MFYCDWVDICTVHVCSSASSGVDPLSSPSPSVERNEVGKLIIGSCFCSGIGQPLELFAISLKIQSCVEKMMD